MFSLSTQFLVVGKDSFSRPAPQPLSVAVRVQLSEHLPPNLDLLQHESFFDESWIECVSDELASHPDYENPGAVAQTVCNSILERGGQRISVAEVNVTLPHGLHQASKVGVKAIRTSAGEMATQFMIERLRLLGHLGCEEDQRKEKQTLYMDICLKGYPGASPTNYQEIVVNLAMVSGTQPALPVLQTWVLTLHVHELGNRECNLRNCRSMSHSPSRKGAGGLG